jgi:hypothetical protein
MKFDESAKKIAKNAGFQTQIKKPRHSPGEAGF